MSLDQITTAIIYGTDTNNTEEVGNKISEKLADFGIDCAVIDVTEASTELLESFDFLILGIPTWDFGGIQEDWENFEPDILSADLSDTTVAFYGLGDQFGYGDYFIDAVGWLHKRVMQTGATHIGLWPVEGYEFNASLALTEDKKHFVGLAVDEDQQFDLTDERIDTWVKQVCAELEAVAA